ncbi:hypothetical protein EV195_101842 [Tenacibaculum skagerrakense]|uniref:Uncharacterized protein n=1 Tax=Tenacibaculum skagerrakense TaxID=186571 RepID=A0A4R2P230_9FLAO|nr:hypothetical protein [Tenacibaculum skagerrakense]TCP28662.1 hypothetical protein EV195_101842 [Tenacibaculum skagerrakense]
MIKSISNLGKVLDKNSQLKINGGGPGDPNWCNNSANWGPRPLACRRGQERVYDYSLGYCVCKAIAVDM